MTLFFIFTQLCFLGILFYYQKKDKIYIGYTTVMTCFFTATIALSLFCSLVGTSSSSTLIWLMLFTLWVLGSILIYLTSQLTLAFEKISQLSQHIGLSEIKKKTED